MQLLEDILPHFSQSEQIIFHVYSGGIHNSQTRRFKEAMLAMELVWNLMGIHIEVEYLTCNVVTAMRWKPIHLVSWLKNSHAHFILTHPHQGKPDWDAFELYDLIWELLYDHQGFPTGNKLSCPIFTQNKFDYITSIAQLVNPTFVIELRKLSLDTEILTENMGLDQFLTLHNEGGNGWVVKLPFTTNKSAIYFCPTKGIHYHLESLMSDPTSVS